MVLTVRSRLFLLVFVALLPVIAVEAYNNWADRHTREQAVERDAHDEALLLAAEVERFVAGIEHLLRAVALSPLSHPDTARECSGYLTGLRSASNGPAGIGVADIRGNVFCLSRNMPEPINVADRQYFARALNDERFAIGEYVIGRRGGVPALHFGLPVRGSNGVVTGIAFVPVNLAWLTERLRSRPWPAAAVARVTDRNGTIVAAYPDDSEVGKRLPPSWGTPSAARRGASLVTPSARIEDLVIGSAPVNETHGELAVWVGLSMPEALRHESAAMRRSIVWTLLSLCLGVGLAYLIAHRHIHRPLRQLEAIVERLCAGDFSGTELPSRSVPEFARLAGAFKRLCGQLRHWQEENAVAQQALRAARDEAIQASRAKTGFIAAASHDLRQPLHAMTLTASLLKLKLRDTAEASLAARMSRSVSHLSDLVNALLDVSQLDAGLIQPDISDFTVESLWEASTEDLTELAQAKQLTLKVGPVNETIRSDARLLRRIVQNLVANAVKYTPASGTVTLGAQRNGAFVDLTISDNGPGIPEEHQAAIWEEFKQLHNPERDPRKGLGLGMAIVKRMADLLDHPVSLQSAQGVGTSVTIRVPRAQPQTHAGRAAAAISMRGAVLLVEDDETIATSTAALLKEWGLDVDTCGTAEAGLAALSHNGTRYDAVLADYRLPGLSGADVVRAARLRLPGVLGLIITGDLASAELATLRASGVQVLTKPLRPDRLAEALAPLQSKTADGRSRAKHS